MDISKVALREVLHHLFMNRLFFGALSKQVNELKRLMGVTGTSAVNFDDVTKCPVASE